MLLHNQKKLLLLLLLPVRCRPAYPAHYSLHRALLSTTAASPAVHFAAEDYLVTTCGLTKKKAAKAAKHLAHHKSPSKADAVLSFLASPATVGLSKPDIARLVSRDAAILNCCVDKTLRPRIDALSSHGFTAAQIRTFLCLAPRVFRHLNVDDKLGFWVPYLGSPDKFLRAIKRSSYFIASDLHGAVKLNIQLLRDSGLTHADVAKLCVINPRLVTSKTYVVRDILARTQQLGFPPGSGMFRKAVSIVSCVAPENMAAKLKFIGEMLGCSHAEVAKAVKSVPVLLVCSTEKLHRVSEFLTKVVGVDSKYILGRPMIMAFSLERRIAPRHYVMKMLQEKGLMSTTQGIFPLVTATDRLFRSKYITPHEDVLPGLANAYAAACKGKLLTTC